jgi:alkylhydroperoxidase/carboxymuconolactone decarboxylase family protein YurZ
VNEQLAADAAAVVEFTDSPAAAERLRDTARQHRIAMGMGGVVGGLDREGREKVVEALKDFSEKETERRQEYTASLQVRELEWCCLARLAAAGEVKPSEVDCEARELLSVGPRCSSQEKESVLAAYGHARVSR